MAADLQAEARRGVTYSGSGAALRRLAAKLLAGQPVSLVAIGGSVTSMGGREPDGESYIARVFQYINTTFPHRQHRMYNEGVPATSSETFEPCVESIVPQDADLVVVEFAINDPGPPISYASKFRRRYEQLLRRLLLLPSKPAVILLQAYPWWMSFGDGFWQGLYYREPETELTVLGQYYDLPVVSVRAAAWRLMQAGIEGFKVDKVTFRPYQRSRANQSHAIPLADASEKDDYFFEDVVHPDTSKLRVLAELAIHPLATAVEEVAAGVADEERQDAQLQGLPPPMIPGVRHTALSSCYRLEKFTPLVKDTQGFEYRPERPEAPSFVLQKWGWSGLQPGHWAELEVDTEQMGRASAKQQAVVELVYLAGHQDMGTAHVTCVSGCTCPLTRLNATDLFVNVFRTHRTNVTPHARCRIRVSIMGVQQPQRQQKVMLSAMMVQPQELKALPWWWLEELRATVHASEAERMKLQDGARVEVSGDPEDPGFAGSWWTAVVVRQQRRGRGGVQITVRYDELLEDDGVTKAEETVPASRVRPACADDSCTKPLADRLPGEPVDCWHDDGWWEGYVHRVYDDHLTVFFPASNEEYTDIHAPAKPPDPTAHRVRTGRNWDAEQGAWVARPRKAFEGSGDFRSKAAAVAAAATAAAPKPAVPKAARALERQASSSSEEQQESSSSSSSEEDVPLIARKSPAAAAAAKGAGQGGRKAAKRAPSKAAQPPAKPPAGQAPPATAPGADGSSSEDELLLFRRGRVAAQAAGSKAQQQPRQKGEQQQQQKEEEPPQPRQQQEQQQQQPRQTQQAPPTARPPAALAAKQRGPELSGGASEAAGNAAAAEARKAPERPEGGLAAANATVADLLTSLDAGDEDEEDGARREPSKTAAGGKELPAAAGQQAPTPAPGAAAAPAVAAKQAAPTAAPPKPRVEASAPAAAGAPPAAAKPHAAAATAVGGPAVPAPRQQSAPKQSVQRQQSAPKQPLQRQQSAPARPAPLQLPTSLGDLKAPPPKQRPPPPPQQVESPVHWQQAGLQLPTSLADLKAPPPKRQRQDAPQAEPPLQRQLSDVQQRKQAQAQAQRPDQRPQDVRQPPAVQAQQQQQQQQQPAAVGGKGKAAAVPQPLQRTGSKGAGRPGGSKPGADRAAATGGAQRLALLIPKRPVGGEGSALESPRARVASPRQQLQQQQREQQQKEQRHGPGSAGELAAQQERKRQRDRDEPGGAARAAVEPDKDGKRGRSAAGFAPPPAAALAQAPAAAAAMARGVPQQRQPDVQYDPTFPTVWCLDNLPAAIDAAVLRQGLGGIGVAGVKSLEVAAVPLDGKDRHGGYAVLRFASAADAQREYDKLHSLCIKTSTCPIPRPLVMRQPRVREGYAWGPEARLPGHFPLDFRANQHFVQPNSIEFDMAIEWRQALGQLAVAKQNLCMEQAAELAQQMAGYLQAVGQPPPTIVPSRLQLSGEVPGPGGGTSSGENAASSTSACVWLSGVLASASEEQLMEAFAQFGFPTKAHVVLDPVTRNPSSHAVLWMESNQRARDLVQVLGQARGSQSTYDRALRCMFGADDSQLAGSVQFVVVKDDELLELPSGQQQLAKLPAAERAEVEGRRAAIALRRLLRSHRKEQDELAAEKRERLRALDAQQRQHFADEKLKLGRLAAIQHQQIGPGVRVYRNKESTRLMRYAEEQRTAQQRAAAAQRAAAQQQRPAARHEPQKQRAAAPPKR
ncbi:hypothetical protein COHA_003543 [Chlorella ohadii]|uniref:Agenet domain-containing protein n=1 Tax=Chlorella ohadii TaxID=2649997 RepID=A0AAD5H7V3_9CHLO|nr:hypothetical protein COHA_003543 [Chlorella ohadii]